MADPVPNLIKQIPPFEYEDELAKGQMRLLKLLTVEASTPHFQLRTVNLPTGNDAATKYVALSYTWGDIPDKVTILVNSQRLEVTASLFAAFAYLEPELRQPGCEIWVDAICINQDDDKNGDEKLGQITQMGEVYHRAERVYVFLGMPFRDSDTGMRDMDRMGRLALEAGIDMVTERNMALWPDFEGLEDEEREKMTRVRKNLYALMDDQLGGLFTRPKIAVEAMNATLTRKWFSRAWIIQEVAVPEPGRVTFACGRERVSWEHMWAAAFFLNQIIFRQLAGYLSMGPWLSSLKLVRLWALAKFRWQVGSLPVWTDVRAATTLGIRRKYWRGDLDRSLKNLLVILYVGDMAVPLGCQMPEDKIRSISSLACEEDRKWLVPTMTQAENWQDLYTMVARRLIAEGHVDILSLCRGSSELPSWVPDWRERVRVTWSGFKNTGSNRVQLFRAGGDTVVDTEGSGQCLKLTSYHVDRIKTIGSLWKADLDDDFDWSAAETVLDEIDNLMKQSTRYVVKAKEEGKWRIPIGDKELGELATHVRATELSHSGWLAMRQAMQTSNPGKTCSGPGSVSYLSMMNYMHGSRPFISETGYVGLCPRDADPGDVIIVPSGGHVPYVLHRVDGAVCEGEDGEDEDWKLLGEAFVYGIMDGELELGTKDARKYRIW
ncbi:hypothetical protein ACJ41O_008979 [Fusarium nematophilum]